MSARAGCFKPVLLGCLGLGGVVVLILLVALLFAWHGNSKREMVEHQAAAPIAVAASAGSAPGRVVLDIGQTQLFVRPAAAGGDLTVEASYDRQAYALTESYSESPDGTWLYQLQFRRTIGWLQAILQGLLSKGPQSRVDIRLPADRQLALELTLKQGGAEIDLCGLWLSEALFAVDQGGLVLAIGEPLREPLDRLVLHGRMGGVTASRLGNASPRLLEVKQRMGGADLDLSGQWRGDCHSRCEVDMGGIQLTVPAALAVRELPAPLSGDPAALETPAAASEGGVATLWLERSARRGEIEVRRR